MLVLKNVWIFPFFFFFLFACLPFNFNHYEISSRKVYTLYLQTNSANSWKWECYSLRENTFCINTLWLFVTQQGFIQALASSQTFLYCFLSIYASNAYLQPGFVAFWLLFMSLHWVVSTRHFSSSNFYWLYLACPLEEVTKYILCSIALMISLKFQDQRKFWGMVHLFLFWIWQFCHHWIKSRVMLPVPILQCHARDFTSCSLFWQELDVDMPISPTNGRSWKLYDFSLIFFLQNNTISK